MSKAEKYYEFGGYLKAQTFNDDGSRKWVLVNIDKCSRKEAIGMEIGIPISQMLDYLVDNGYIIGQVKEWVIAKELPKQQKPKGAPDFITAKDLQAQLKQSEVQKTTPEQKAVMQQEYNNFVGAIPGKVKEISFGATDKIAINYQSKSFHVGATTELKDNENPDMAMKQLRFWIQNHLQAIVNEELLKFEQMANRVGK